MTDLIERLRNHHARDIVDFDLYLEAAAALEAANARIAELEQKLDKTERDCADLARNGWELEAQIPAAAGWKLVPVEPTMEMVVDGFESWPSRMFSEPEEWIAYEAMSGCQQAAHRARLCYAAMLAAAPSAETIDAALAQQENA